MEGGTGRPKMVSAPQQTAGETELEAETPAAIEHLERQHLFLYIRKQK